MIFSEKGQLHREEAVEEKGLSERLLERERGLFQKFEGKGGGKVKRVITAFILGSSLMLGAGTAGAYTVEKYSESAKENEAESRENKAIEMLERLYTLPNNPNALNEAHNNALKREAART